MAGRRAIRHLPTRERARRATTWHTLAWLAALPLASGCYVSHRRPNPPPSRRDAGPADASARDGGRGDATRTSDAGARDAWLAPDAGRGDAGPPREMPCERPVGVDLLFVLDDSGSLRPEDLLIRRRIMQMVGGLLAPPDLDGDGVEDWPRVLDMHVGVTTSSAEGPGFCPRTLDGRLMRGEGARLPECSGTYPPVIRYPEMGGPDEIATAVGCLGFGPRDGCTVEQPLEAMAKALLPSSAPFDYVEGGAHGDLENAGFLRESSVLVVVIIANEDDCSVVDPIIFEPRDAGPIRPPDPPTGCILAPPGALQPIARYRDMFGYLRPAHPERVVFAVVAGFTEPIVLDVRASFGDPCGTDSFPTRLIDVARTIPDRSVGASVCVIEELAVVQAVARRIADASCED